MRKFAILLHLAVFALFSRAAQIDREVIEFTSAHH